MKRKGEVLRMILCTVLHSELQTVNIYHLCVKVGVSYVFSCDQKKQNKFKKKIPGPFRAREEGFRGHDPQM